MPLILPPFSLRMGGIKFDDRMIETNHDVIDFQIIIQVNIARITKRRVYPSRYNE
jgi:hypothetical protein